MMSRKEHDGQIDYVEFREARDPLLEGWLRGITMYAGSEAPSCGASGG